MDSYRVIPPGIVELSFVDNDICYSSPGKDDYTFLASTKLQYGRQEGSLREMWNIHIRTSNSPERIYHCPNGQVPIDKIFYDLAIQFGLQLDPYAYDLRATVMPYIYKHEPSGTFFFEGHQQDIDRRLFGPYETSPKASKARCELEFPKKPDPYSLLNNQV